ncbi:MAG: hypothetical protein J0H66_09975 [Solirubrobacterales bacterium]|nr:hypothetical protein [Solirubrobacterales bacterium]OJU93742.1 MAG: hypothetical protein BGO23_14065 [Solirubrobacterales bacterium 67-14]
MSHRLKMVVGMALAFAVLATPQPAFAFDAGVKPPVLADPLPGAVSRPFEIPVTQSEAEPQPLHFEIAVAGFNLDPDPVAGRRIGSLDMTTDSGTFGDRAIYSNGPGFEGIRYWTLDWRLSSNPILATVENGAGLDADGLKITDPGSTLIGFTVPGNYHGFRLMGLDLRFNQQEKGRSTPGVGAVNPALAGDYLIRSRIESVAPPSAVAVASTSVRVGPPAPKTKLMVGVNRSRVRPVGRIRISLRTVNQTRDTASVWLRGHRLRRLTVGPGPRYLYWRVKPRFRGQRLRFRIKPSNGPARQLVIRVTD